MKGEGGSTSSPIHKLQAEKKVIGQDINNLGRKLDYLKNKALNASNIEIKKKYADDFNDTLKLFRIREKAWYKINSELQAQSDEADIGVERTPEQREYRRWFNANKTNNLSKTIQHPIELEGEGNKHLKGGTGLLRYLNTKLGVPMRDILGYVDNDEDRRNILNNIREEVRSDLPQFTQMQLDNAFGDMLDLIESGDDVQFDSNCCAID
jgi:hypothetical protein